MIIAIVPLFFLELFLSLKLSSMVGFGWSLFGVLFTMLVGILLLRSSPYAFMGNITSVQLGKLDFNSANRASMAYLMGSLLLIIPGVISDIFGVVAVLYMLYLRFLANIRPQHKQYNHKNTQGDNDVIDVEIIDE